MAVADQRRVSLRIEKFEDGGIRHSSGPAFGLQSVAESMVADHYGRTEADREDLEPARPDQYSALGVDEERIPERVG